MSQPRLSLSKSIAIQIEQMILDSSLLPNQKIPSERQLCAKLKVSRSAVREALKDLQARQLIVTKQGQGSFVADIIAQPEIQSPMMHLYYDHNRTLFDLYEVREQLEGQAAFLAAQRANDKDIYRITKAYNAMQNDTKKPRAHYDQAFHQAIVEASHNPVLIHVLASLEELILHSVQASVSNLYHIEELKQQMDKHHYQIYQAVSKGQAKKAQRIATAHVLFVRNYLQTIEEQGQNIIREALKL